MGRIDRAGGRRDKTMERNHIKRFLLHVEEYEQVKLKKHPRYKNAQDFYQSKQLVRQNFLKYYMRYVLAGRDPEALLPRTRGRKFQDTIKYTPEVIEKVKEIRSYGYNCCDIARFVQQSMGVVIAKSTLYRLLKKLGLNKLNPELTLKKVRYTKMHIGEMGHIDVHYVAKGTVSEVGAEKLYIVGIIDDHSRLCWLEVIKSIKALDVMFATLGIITHLKTRYNIEFKEMLSDNGSELASKNNEEHPVEALFQFFGIKHRYTQPFRPQTNGKIERFWKTLESEALDGEVFETLQEFKEYLLAYVIYYNEHRTHQGIGEKIPMQMLG